MVKFTEINKAIVDKLELKFMGIPIKSTNVEKIVRPSFCIDFDNIKVDDFMDEALDRNITVRIYYYATDRYKNKIENLNIQDDLTLLFLEDNILEVNESTKIQIEELEFDLVDGVLVMNFDIFISEDYNRIDDTPNMEELEII